MHGKNGKSGIVARKSDQLYRDFGVVPPARHLNASLRRRSDAEVTPFTLSVVRDRIAEFGGGVDALIILLMRGARVEALAKAVSERLPEFLSGIRDYLKRLVDPSPLYALAAENTNLWWRV